MKISRMVTATLLVLPGLGGCPTGRLADERICTELVLDSVRAGGLGIKAAAPRETLWRHNAFLPMTLTVKFLNGSTFQRQKVEQYVNEWSEASATTANPDRLRRLHKIGFSFVPDSWNNALADIRVTFRPGGSASYVGSEARKVDPSKPTMYFGWVTPGQPEAVLRQVIVHEFGHALGLVHEHQSPTAHVPWDREKVYEYYRTTQDPPWTREEVDANIFALYDASTTNYTTYDSLSIMHYAIPNSLTVGDYSTPWNSTLSNTDTAFIKRIYPYYECVINESENCCFNRQGRRVPCL